MERKRMLISFLLGGGAVVLSNLISTYSPWKMLGGIAATFPSVMIVSVMMMGIAYGSKKATEVAKGSVYGMLGCAICVISVLFFLQISKVWWMSICMGLLLWYLGAFLIYKMRESSKHKMVASKK